MDLRISGAVADERERAAIDAMAGPDGGSPFADAGHAARARRHLLLPALHAVMDAVGWISEGALAHVARRLSVPPADVYGVATFYAMFSLEERAPHVVHVCDDVACDPAELIDGLTAELGPAGEGKQTCWVRSPCLGLCERAPAVMLQLARQPDVSLAPATAARVVAALGRAADHADALALPPDGPSGSRDSLVPGPRLAHASASRGLETTELRAPDEQGAVEPIARISETPVEDEAFSSAQVSVPQAGQAGLRLLRRVGVADPESLDDYRAHGGYSALRRAVELGPARVIKEVTDSSLTGRGGAAFPTGVKWEGVATAPARPHYLVCNADESEPGTFKDRVLMEHDPFALIEAMTIAGYATGCERGYLYIRGEYPLATRRLQHAIAAARTRGYLGADVLGAGFAFDIELRRGAGAYICGEETALLNSIEGFRGEPRNKPPFPSVSGLFGRPTVINNVETLLNVLPVLETGGPAFAQTGAGRSTGTKLFCVSGTVGTPGVYEVDFGTTLRELLDLAGGAPDLRAVLLGGAAGGFVLPDRLDVPLTLEGTREIGATLGSGVVLAFDSTADLTATLRRIAAFFRDESCGQCVPCRVGTVRQEEALARLTRGAPRGPELALLDDLARVMQDASICGLGQTAPAAVLSALKLRLL